MMPSCGPVVVRWECQNGNIVQLCQACLDAWLDNADDDEMLEPAAWSWLRVGAVS
jgi:hypothetical protein